MTIHLAKGLEFHVCCRYGGRFISLCDEYEHTIRTRRRTSFVLCGVNKSRTPAYLTAHALPLGKLTDSEPSRFIEEIDAQYLEYLTPAESSHRYKSMIDKDIFGDVDKSN
jgi:DNA helicase-2/ATP-dependent DNA helicase PcrA